MLPNLLLYTLRDQEIDEYAQLVQSAQLPLNLMVCRSPAEAQAAIPQADIVFGVHLPGEIYALASRLKWIQSMWAGVERLLPAPLPLEVVITKPWGVFGQYISQYVFGHLLARRIHLMSTWAAQQEHKWQPYRIEPIRGTRLGIAGMGDIGTDLAKVGRSLGMEIWGLNRDGRTHPLVDQMFAQTDLTEFVAGVDVVVIILPATAETKGLFNRQIFAAMPRHALLINVGRGAIIDDEALIEALSNQQIAGAVLDVFVQEPLPPEHPYWQLPNCIVTPHIGGPSLPADITRCFVTNFQRFSAGEPLLAEIDKTRGY